jgi:hypothetical protein
MPDLPTDSAPPGIESPPTPGLGTPPGSANHSLTPAEIAGIAAFLLILAPVIGTLLVGGLVVGEAVFLFYLGALALFLVENAAEIIVGLTVVNIALKLWFNDTVERFTDLFRSAFTLGGRAGLAILGLGYTNKLSGDLVGQLSEWSKKCPCPGSRAKPASANVLDSVSPPSIALAAQRSRGAAHVRVLNYSPHPASVIHNLASSGVPQVTITVGKPPSMHAQPQAPTRQTVAT